MDDREQKQASLKSPPKRISDYIAAVVFDIVVLVVVNKVPDWNIPFVTEAYPDILWAVNTSLAVSIAGNLVLIFFHPRFLHHLLNAVFSGFGILVSAVLVSVFPFDFTNLAGEWLTILIRIVLIVGIVGGAIGAVVHIVKAVAAIFRSGD
jgi:hypothetical protein